jgi:glycosyltransferase involved in cell wall biosynthesis
MHPPRVAYLPDSFHEVNGVAHTSRNFAAFAALHDLPFLCIRASAGTHSGSRLATRAGNHLTLDLRRSPIAVRLEKDLRFDPLFWRHANEISRRLQAFQPDVIHITGPSELGILGAYFAWKHSIPLAASWHTNLHEYAARRLRWLTRRLPQRWAAHLESKVQAASLAIAARFYAFARVLFAPNAELCAMLEQATGKSCHLMQRGVDTQLFSPTRRTRSESSPDLVLGYVGRLSVEKNVALLVTLERELAALGIADIRFLIVGWGDDEEDLHRDLRVAEFPGVLRGVALATAYANMDILVFPSHTDTFGNVVLEALASGVPAIVTPDGGPKYIVRDGETGFVAPDTGFAAAVATLVRDRTRLNAMRLAARAHALTCSWDSVFSQLYETYLHYIAEPRRASHRRNSLIRRKPYLP